MSPAEDTLGKGWMRQVTIWLESRSKVGEEKGLWRGQHQEDPIFIPGTFSMFIFKAKLNPEEIIEAFSMHRWKAKATEHSQCTLRRAGSRTASEGSKRNPCIWVLDSGPHCKEHLSPT